MDLTGLGLKIVGQTNFGKPSVWYDVDNPVPEEPSRWRAMVSDIVKPVVQIQTADGRVIYKTGEFYSPTGQYWLMGFGIVALIAVVAVASKVSNK